MAAIAISDATRPRRETVRTARALLLEDDADPLRVLVGREGEVRVREGRIERPIQASGVSRVGGIAPVDDHQLARQRLIPLLDPDLPVDVALTEGVVIGLHALQRGRADLEG